MAPTGILLKVVRVNYKRKITAKGGKRRQKRSMKQKKTRVGVRPVAAS